MNGINTIRRMNMKKYQEYLEAKRIDRMEKASLLVWYTWNVVYRTIKKLFKS